MEAGERAGKERGDVESVERREGRGDIEKREGRGPEGREESGNTRGT